MNKKVALVTGAGGVVGRNLIEYLSDQNDWEVIGLSRRRPDTQQNFQHISVDLLDHEDTRKKLGKLSRVTHIFNGAYIETPTYAELVEPNLRMLRHVVETIENISQSSLQHVHLVHGTKYYGNHLGPFKTPAKESDPRHIPPNFYYAQEDYIVQQQEGKPWSWSACRPHAICGFAVGNPMNLSMVLAIYASISKELGLPLCHPGTAGNFHALYQCTDASLLARAIIWMSTTPKCANEAFNITNGDFFRWENLWPQLAKFFDMEVGHRRHINLSEMMSDKAELWQRMIENYGLQPYDYDEIVSWKYGDFVFGAGYDIMSDTTKARRFGFNEVLDTEEMLINLMSKFRDARVIP